MKNLDLSMVEYISVAFLAFVLASSTVEAFISLNLERKKIKQNQEIIEIYNELNGLSAKIEAENERLSKVIEKKQVELEIVK